MASFGGRDQNGMGPSKIFGAFSFLISFARFHVFMCVREGKVVDGEVSWGEPFSRYSLRAVIDSEKASDKLTALKRVERLMKKSRFDLDSAYR